jgi:hypothetical protein
MGIKVLNKQDMIDLQKISAEKINQFLAVDALFHVASL